MGQERRLVRRTCWRGIVRKSGEGIWTWGSAERRRRGEGADGGKGVVGRMGGWPVLLAGRARGFDLVGRADWVAVQSGQGMVKEQVVEGGSIRQAAAKLRAGEGQGRLLGSESCEEGRGSGKGRGRSAGSWVSARRASSRGSSCSRLAGNGRGRCRASSRGPSRRKKRRLAGADTIVLK